MSKSVLPTSFATEENSKPVQGNVIDISNACAEQNSKLIMTQSSNGINGNIISMPTVQVKEGLSVTIEQSGNSSVTLEGNKLKVEINGEQVYSGDYDGGSSLHVDNTTVVIDGNEVYNAAKDPTVPQNTEQHPVTVSQPSQSIAPKQAKKTVEVVEKGRGGCC